MVSWSTETVSTVDASGPGDFRECVALARFDLDAPVNDDSDLVFRLVMFNFNPSTVTSQYKFEQEFLIL